MGVGSEPSGPIRTALCSQTPRKRSQKNGSMKLPSRNQLLAVAILVAFTASVAHAQSKRDREREASDPGWGIFALTGPGGVTIDTAPASVSREAPDLEVLNP